jgi:hypothetical protein
MCFPSLFYAFPVFDLIEIWPTTTYSDTLNKTAAKDTILPYPCLFEYLGPLQTAFEY